MGQKGGTKEVNLFVIGETNEEYEVQEGLTCEGRGMIADGMGRIWAVRGKVQGGPVENDHRHCQKGSGPVYTRTLAGSRIKARRAPHSVKPPTGGSDSGASASWNTAAAGSWQEKAGLLTRDRRRRSVTQREGRRAAPPLYKGPFRTLPQKCLSLSACGDGWFNPCPLITERATDVQPHPAPGVQSDSARHRVNKIHLIHGGLPWRPEQQDPSCLWVTMEPRATDSISSAGLQRDTGSISSVGYPGRQDPSRLWVTHGDRIHLVCGLPTATGSISSVGNHGAQGSRPLAQAGGRWVKSP
ncbi:unnamed protein product [Boreogadus saida]